MLYMVYTIFKLLMLLSQPVFIGYLPPPHGHVTDTLLAFDLSSDLSPSTSLLFAEEGSPPPGSGSSPSQCRIQSPRPRPDPGP